MDRSVVGKSHMQERLESTRASGLTLDSLVFGKWRLEPRTVAFFVTREGGFK